MVKRAGRNVVMGRGRKVERKEKKRKERKKKKKKSQLHERRVLGKVGGHVYAVLRLARRGSGLG